MATKSRVIKRKRKQQYASADTPPEIKQENKLRIASNRQLLKTKAQKVAGHPMWHKNWGYRGGIDVFPHSASMRYVLWYFPHAIGGPLYIDEPTTKQEIEACEKKSKAIKVLNNGYRYIYITTEMSVAEALTELDN